MNDALRLAIADPPYFGCCGLYEHRHEGLYGCWDDLESHACLFHELERYDGWVLHSSSVALSELLRLAMRLGIDGFRVMAWVKPFAAFKKNVSVAYAWEPVLVKPARKPEVTGRCVMRDFISEPITMKRGLTGAKPERVCLWAFEMLGAQPDDELVDLFPGSGAVSRAWDKFRQQLDFANSARGVTP